MSIPLFYLKGVESNLWKLMAFNFLERFRPYFIVMVIYFEHVLGSYTAAMSLITVTVVSAVLFEIPTGYWSDKVGRRKTLIGCALAHFLSILFFCISAQWEFLLIACILDGLMLSLRSGCISALIYETLKESGRTKDYSHVFGKIQSGLHIGLALGAVIGGILASQSYIFAFYAALGSSFLAVILSFTFVEPKVEHQRTATRLKDVKDAFLLMIKNKQLRCLAIANE